MSTIRIAILYAELSGHISACLKALAEQTGVELLVVHWPRRSEAPFDDTNFSWIHAIYNKAEYTQPELNQLIDGFNPDAVLISGWMDKDYLQITRKLRKWNVLVVAGMDAPWTASIRQKGAALLAPWYLHPKIGVMWVPGIRQRRFAEKLGYTGEKCWNGLLSCDWDVFAAAYNTNVSNRKKAFLFVGRYIESKGIDILVEAYGRYRMRVSDPLELHVAGAGELESTFHNTEGIQDLGFVQPSDVPKLMSRATAFVLPSRHEPWGVVVHEAAASGLPMIVSDACGAIDSLVNHGKNGFIFQSGDAAQLVECMVQLHNLSPGELTAMGRTSHELSKQFKPTAWADIFIAGIRQHGSM